MAESDGMLTIEESARACGVSTETIRRRLRAGSLGGAHQTGTSGQWRIPVSSLVAAGLQVRIGSPAAGNAAPPELEAARIQGVAEERLERIRLLERQVEQLRELVDVLRECLAQEVSR